MNAEAIAGMIRHYRAIVTENRDGVVRLLVPADFNSSYRRTIEFTLGAKEVQFEQLNTNDWEEKASAMLPQLEACVTRVTYRVSPSFERPLEIEVTFDRKRRLYQLRRSVDGQQAGEFRDIDDQKQIEQSIVALLQSALPLSRGRVLGCDGTSYRLRIDQGFNGVEISWWSGGANLPDSVHKLTGLLEELARGNR